MYKQRLAFKEEDNSVLLEKLKAHGEDIETLKKELAAKPRTFIQEEEPKDLRPGDMWVKP